MFSEKHPSNIFGVAYKIQVIFRVNCFRENPPTPHTPVAGIV